MVSLMVEKKVALMGEKWVASKESWLVEKKVASKDEKMVAW